MGMFLSQYSMLKSIGYHDDKHINAETNKILSPFKLFVLVLHDPTGHITFHQKFSKLFERLDYLTGQHLLFMGIARPSLNWYKRNEDRDYFGIWEKEQLMNTFHEIKSGDNSITCYSIATSLNIDYDELPALVITSSLSSNSFVILKTDKTVLEKQLMELGLYASSFNHGNGYPDTPEFKRLINEINYLNQSEIRKETKPLASILADTLSFTVFDNSHFSKDAHDHAQNVILKKQKEITNNNDFETIENVKLNILSNLANQQYCKNRSKFSGFVNGCMASGKILEDLDSLSSYEFQNRHGTKSDDLSKTNETSAKSPEYVLQQLCDEYINVEIESRIISNTTKLVYDLYKNQRENMAIDYSPLVLGISKIFEIEINLSAVHWIRKYLNIELPAYFKKHKPSCDNAKIAPDISLLRKGDIPQSINFNHGKNNKWLAPGIGQSELIIRTLYKRKELVESFSENEETELLNAWTAIRELRNSAGHTEIMSMVDFQKITGHMGELINSGNLNKIISLKTGYRGN